MERLEVPLPRPSVLSLMASATVLLACSGSSKDTRQSQPQGPTSFDYMLGSGHHATVGNARTAGLSGRVTIEADRKCSEVGEELVCETSYKRSFDGQVEEFQTRTVVRASGVYDTNYRDPTSEVTLDALVLPDPTRLPFEWDKEEPTGPNSKCSAKRDDSICEGAIITRCETPQGDAVVIGTRLYCPDKGKALRRRLGTYSDLCEEIIEITYENWTGAEPVEQLAKPLPKDCTKTSPIGWVHQTPNRAWSVALPARGRMVLGPNQWTVNLHQETMSFNAYEGTGPNASVKSDADIPMMVEQLKATVAPIINATVGAAVKRGEPDSVDWEIPLTSESGAFAGMLRLIARDGAMYSLTTTGPDEEAARAFIDSFTVHGEEFASNAVAEMANWFVQAERYKSQVCACADLACAQAIAEVTPPKRGFPTADQEKQLATIMGEINECATRLTGEAPSESPPNSP